MVCLVSKWEQPLVVAHVQIVYMIIHVFPLCTHKECIFVPVHLVRCYTTLCGSRVLQNTPANTPHILLCNVIKFWARCTSSNPYKYCIPSSCSQHYGPSLAERCLQPEQLIKDLWDALFTKLFSREGIPASSLICQLCLFLCQWYWVTLCSAPRHSMLVTQ